VENWIEYQVSILGGLVERKRAVEFGALVKRFLRHHECISNVNKILGCATPQTMAKYIATVGKGKSGSWKVRVVSKFGQFLAYLAERNGV
jgi:hypothetical protein